MGFFSDLKWKLSEVKTDLKDNIDDKIWDLKYGTAKDRVKVVAETGAFLYNPILYLGAKKGMEVIGDKINERVDDKVNERTLEMKQKHAAEISRLKRVIEEMTPTEFYNFTVAGAALAFAVANADGEFSVEEREEILPLILGESASAMPENLQNIFCQFIESPPDLQEALEYVKKVNNSYWNKFDWIIEMTINIDGKITEEEKSFYKAWMNFKKLSEVD
ncbi:MAG: hypothetical protein AAGU01_08820 [Clostridiaceae bacterium]